MDKIISRTGEEITIYFKTSKGNTVELHDVKEFKRLIGEGNKIDYIIEVMALSAKRREPSLISKLGSVMIKKVLRDRNAVHEAKALRNEVEEKRLEEFTKKVGSITEARLKFNDTIIQFYPDMRFLFLIKQVFISNQYNALASNIKGKEVVDAGANVGVFSLMCAALGAKKIYAFEPVNETYSILVEFVKRNNLQEFIIPINKALGNSNGFTEIRFSNVGDVGATIIPISDNTPRTIQKAEVVRLDDFLKNKKIDFIKMDVEGYEEQVLLGATNSIKKFKPILSFSAYHKPTDRTRLPEVVKGIRDDYEISMTTFDDPNFYCA